MGGYVKIAGMIDESMDTEQMKQPEQPWEFRSKPAWQRLLIMVGGVLFNFLLALFIYSMILFAWGDQYIKVQEAPLGMDFNETAKSVGFKDGDILLSADGVPFERYDGDMLSQIADAREVSVIRNGAKASVYIPEDLMQRLLADSIRFASYRFHPGPCGLGHAFQMPVSDPMGNNCRKSIQYLQVQYAVASIFNCQRPPTHAFGKIKYWTWARTGASVSRH